MLQFLNFMNIQLNKIFFVFKPNEINMNNKIKRQKSSIILVLVILLTIACNRFYEYFPSSSSFKPGDPTATPLGSDITDPNFIKGVQAFKERNYSEVLTRMNAVIEATPNLAPAYRYRGAAYLSLGNCQAGLADEEKALSIIPKYGAAFGARGALYGCLGNPEQELKDYDKALSIDPSLAFVHHNLGVYYYNRGDYEKSLEEYNLSIAIDPYRSDAWSGMSEAYARLGNFGGCLESAVKAIKLNPKEWIAYLDEGICDLMMGSHNYEGAEISIKIYLEHVPFNSCAWVKLGIAQARQLKYEEAVSSYDKALELDPISCEAYINRGDTFINLGEYEKALDDYNHAIALGDPIAYSGRGTAYYWLGEYDEAIADLELATQQIPNNSPAYSMLGLAYLKVGRYQDALDAAATVNQIQPGYKGQTIFEIQSRAYYGLGDYEQALSYINKAIEMNDYYPGYYTGYYYRGIIYQTTGKNAEAITDFEKFLSVVPDNKKLQEEVADAKKRLAELRS